MLRPSPASPARSSTLRSPWASRSSSSSRFGLARAFPARANCSYRAWGIRPTWPTWGRAGADGRCAAGPAGGPGGRHRLAAAFAADTHLHADFLSGAPQLAAQDGAQILASASGGRAFGHRGLADGDEVDLGGLTLRAWATARPYR